MLSTREEEQSHWLSRGILFGKNRILQVIITAFTLIWIYLAIKPYSRYDWVLENLLIWAAVVFLAVMYRFFRFSNLSYLLIAIFLYLHAVGAHYSYNENIVDVWMKQLFHAKRDNFDRVVHFSYGLLLAYPLREALKVWTKLGNAWLNVLTCMIILATGAFYELIEMWVAMIVAPEIGTLFLGTQGDPWDSQHDMELALYGSILAMVVAAVVRRIRLNAYPHS
ncbi:DUF2238 domain-containing protein [Paenibacillus hexagrammi]|uniref:DUF2238 domain-containing protein n=1 Tax=Paenibacillus hexagrammi TaxID=2908839 RepID=A0ABY3SFF4_9BACL|nr:DUF2238 domain-containing protein [Paenibacillus sp. YPD9-1]UJF31906.1 DUF2238 domain-containing protein [Paenibacillus sp. YPD9-1]